MATEMSKDEYITLLEGKLDKSNIEFSRYKQDCRKRSLEMAHLELMSGTPPISTSSDFTVEDRANRYYKWLIEIPQ